MSNDVPDVRKALFTSPGMDMGMDMNERIDSGSNAANLNSRLLIDQEMDTVLKSTKKDVHEKRLKKFRQIAKYLHEDDWRYPSVDKLIGGIRHPPT